MSAANVSYSGATNLANATDAQQRSLFLKVFAGEVITQFERHTVALDKHSVRTIKSGKTAQFPVFGNMPNAEYHVPGTEILGQQVPLAERTISIDRLLISHIFVADIDEAMSHFDARSKYSSMMGQKLAQTFDNHVMRHLVNAAAETAAVVTGGAASTTIAASDDLKSATLTTHTPKWVNYINLAAGYLDTAFATGERYLLLKPADLYKIMEASAINSYRYMDKQFGGTGSIAEGNFPQISNVNLVPTPMLPTADYTGEDYNAIDCQKVVGIVFTPDAVGTVKLMDISVQAEWDIRRQGTLMVGRYAMGHGKLRSECSYVFKTAT